MPAICAESVIPAEAGIQNHVFNPLAPRSWGGEEDLRGTLRLPAGELVYLSGDTTKPAGNGLCPSAHPREDGERESTVE
jgi:hypothetical protein